jgi:hypothetical protein
MRFRTGVIVGFAAGYYLGARAGRERYEQLRTALDALPLGRVVSKTEALAELARERFRPGGSENVLPFRSASGQ